MNTTDKKADEYANGMMGIGTYSEQWEWADKYMYNCLKKSYLAGHAAALSSGGSNCIEGDEEKVQKLRKICSVWLRSYNNVYESTNEMVDEILEVINDN